MSLKKKNHHHGSGEQPAADVKGITTSLKDLRARFRSPYGFARRNHVKPKTP
jgi:hypothetical protein